jgi:hypothetical protein
MYLSCWVMPRELRFGPRGGDIAVTINFTEASVTDVFNFLINTGHWSHRVVDDKMVSVTVQPER